MNPLPSHFPCEAKLYNVIIHFYSLQLTWGNLNVRIPDLPQNWPSIVFPYSQYEDVIQYRVVNIMCKHKNLVMYKFSLFLLSQYPIPKEGFAFF